MTAPAIPLANMTSVCSDCGAVFWTADGHSCSGRAEGQCPGCGVLQRQVDALAEHLGALDRGVADAGTTASRALAAARAQAGVHEAFEQGKRAIAVAQGTAPPKRPARARRRPRTAPHTGRPSLSLVPPGGVA